jgi:hypothetical protein
MKFPALIPKAKPMFDVTVRGEFSPEVMARSCTCVRFGEKILRQVSPARHGWGQGNRNQ